jgi:hypothetical protein
MVTRTTVRTESAQDRSVRPQRGDRLPTVLLADELSFGLAPLVVERRGVVGQKVNEDAVVAAQAV